MKRLLPPIIALLLCLFSGSLWAQDIITEASVGVFMSDANKPAVLLMTGGDIKVTNDTVRGLIIALKPHIVYANQPDDIQGALTELLALKTLDVFSASKLHFGIGTAWMVDIKDDADEHRIGIDITTGLNVKNWVSVSLTGLYFPGTEGNNMGAVLFGVNIAPPF